MTEHLNRCHFGDARAVLRRMAADGVRVQMCVTSPPYFGLRSYLPDGHTDKTLEIGLEHTPDEYVQTLVEVFRGVREVLADDGVLWLNLGDSYAGYHGNKKHAVPTSATNGWANGTNENLRGDKRPQDIGLKPKDLIGIPWRVAFALQADGWYLRQDIVWAKPAAMPESVTDRCTKSHEYVFLLSKKERYYFDHEAIKEPGVGGAAAGSNRTKRDSFKREASKREQAIPGQSVGTHRPDRREDTWDTGRRNKRSVWTVPTKGYAGAHFAVFPPALVQPCVLAGTSARGHCPVCGARWVRQSEPVIQAGHTGDTASAYAQGSTANRLAMLRQAAREQGVEYTGARRTTGWAPGCKCGVDPVPDVVLDPFFGSGTSGQVAQQLGRHFIGIDLNRDYQTLQNERLRQGALELMEAA